jgi:hypothetical protein
VSLDIWLYVDVDTGRDEPTRVEITEWANYTHNVTPMWSAAGCYEALYKSAGKPAGEILPALNAAVDDMAANPAKYEALNPKNGWGEYRSALAFLRQFRDACAEHPKALVGVSR